MYRWEFGPGPREKLAQTDGTLASVENVQKVENKAHKCDNVLSHIWIR